MCGFDFQCVCVTDLVSSLWLAQTHTHSLSQYCSAWNKVSLLWTTSRHRGVELTHCKSLDSFLLSDKVSAPHKYKYEFIREKYQ